MMGFLLDGRTDRSPTTNLYGDLTTKPSSNGGRPSSPDAEISRGLGRYSDVPAFGLLQHAAEVIPNRDAIVYGDIRWNYAELNHASLRAAAMLQRLGVEPGDRVGILLPNVPEYIIAANAIWRAGAIAVAISPLMVEEEVEALIDHTGCRHVVCLDMLSHLVRSDRETPIQTLLVSIRQHLPSLHQLGYLWARHSRTGCWTLPTTDTSRWFWDEIEQTDRSWQPITIDPALDPAYILPTGGTTGLPKAVTLSHTNMVANAWQQFEWTERTFAKETMLAVLPFFHSYGMSATIMGGAAMGATLVLHHRFHTRQVIQLLEQHRPTVFHAVPAMLVAMNERFRNQPPNIAGLRWVISGGAPLDEEVAREFASFTGAHVVEGYGLSEASPVTHVGHLFREPCYGTIGYALPKTKCRIVSANEASPESSPVEASKPEDTDLAVGEVGELLVRGPQVMLGYWRDPVASKTAIENGWLHTGDLAVRSADGTYEIVGRKKDLIITSGFNVYPREVEDVLRQADGVLDAAVIGTSDVERGEVVTAHVVLESGVAWDEQMLRYHCAEHLSKHKRPRYYVHCENDLPRNFLGKVVRRQLREQSADRSEVTS